MRYKMPAKGDEIILLEDYIFRNHEFFNNKIQMIPKNSNLKILDICIGTISNHIILNIPSIIIDGVKMKDIKVKILPHQINDMDYEYQDYNVETYEFCLNILKRIDMIFNYTYNRTYYTIVNQLFYGKHIENYKPKITIDKFILKSIDTINALIGKTPITENNNKMKDMILLFNNELRKLKIKKLLC